VLRPPYSPTRAQLILVTDPVNFKVGGHTYTMGLTAYKVIGRAAVVEMDVERESGYAQQFYAYTFRQGGVGFTANLANLKAAHLASGGSVSPSTVHLAYAASLGTVVEGRCTLTNGTRTSYPAQSMGKITVSSMSIATGSSFFGNLKIKPLTASVGYDPGCRGGSGQATRICTRSTITAGAPTGTEWEAFGLHGMAKAVEGTISTAGVSNGLTVTQEVAMFDSTPNIMPDPTFSKTGATAELKTTNDPFMHGSATFTSTQPPVVSKPHTCTDFKTFADRTYVVHVCRGMLVPDSGSPLTALFDAGAIPLIAQPAQLDKVIYTG